MTTTAPATTETKKPNGTPTEAALPKLTILTIASIDESPTNPRKTFTGIEELAADIAKRGLIHAVLVRPKAGGRYELVVGARRFRATKLAKLPTIMATVRELDDATVVETQIIENSERVDVHPLEEADGYRTLHERFKYSADQIAAKVNKSRSWVFGRLKLCGLTEKSRKAFVDGKLSASTALRIARISPPELQDAALKRLTDHTNDGETVSDRDAADIIQREFMLRLADVSWDLDDAKLVAKAGSCTACPKRTGNQRELFSDVKATDLCTDRNCFEAKRDAAWEIQKAEAKAKGQQVVEGNEAKEQFFRYGTTQVYSDKYVDLDAKEYDHRTGKETTLRKQLKKDAPAPILVRDPYGGVHEVVPKSALDSVEKATSSGDSYSKQQKEAAAKAKLKAAAVREALALMVEKAEARKPDDAWFKTLALALVEQCNLEPVGDCVRRRGLGHGGVNGVAQKELRAAVNGMTPAQHRGLIVELVAHTHAGPNMGGYQPQFNIWAKAYGVSVEKLHAKVVADAKAKKVIAKAGAKVKGLAKAPPKAVPNAKPERIAKAAKKPATAKKKGGAR